MHSDPTHSRIFFWDKLDKRNYYLELSIELAEEPHDSRIVWHLPQDAGSVMLNILKWCASLPKITIFIYEHSF